MSKQKVGKASALGESLRSAAIAVYVEKNPEHSAPGWDELHDWSRATWEQIAGEMVKRGWKPPASLGTSFPDVPTRGRGKGDGVDDGDANLGRDYPLFAGGDEEAGTTED